jgi:LmbE family N-acetylglucosaminyl deacetylase
MTIRSVEQLGTILSVWAHPDDEAYLAAGIMAAATQAGQRVVCVTATKGEGGSPDPDRWSPEQMADIRERELYACLEVLGVDEHQWLGYVDGSCHEVAVAEGVDKLEAILDDVRPDTVLTFGPDGHTGHPDHRAISAWMTEAHRRARGRRLDARLHYVTQTPEWIDDFGGPWRAIDAFPAWLPTSTRADRLSIEIVLPAELADRKVAALGRQASQTDGVRTLLGEDFYRRSLDVERYRPAP